MKSKSYQEQMGRGKGKEKGMEKDQASKKKSPIFGLCIRSKVKHCTFWYLILSELLLLGKKSLFQQS